MYRRICQQDIEIALLKEQVALLTRQRDFANVDTNHRFFNQYNASEHGIQDEEPREKRGREDDAGALIDETESDKKMIRQTLPQK